MIKRLRQLYSDLAKCWAEGIRAYTMLSAAAFFLLFLIFFALGFLFPELQERFFGMTQSSMASSGIIQEDGSIDAAMLLSNNISACGFIMLYGFLPFIRFPALALGTNAMVMGCTAVWYCQNSFSLLVFAAGILPHGIVELPAMFLAFGTGLYICNNVSRRIRKDASALGPWSCMVILARVHLLVLIPLLTAAAMLETYVTPRVLELFA